MRISAFLAGAAILLASSGAMAAQGPKLLTTSSKTERSSMTAGVSYKEINGVTLITGAAQAPAAAMEDALLGASPAPVKQQVVVKIERKRWRRLRHLRTQGFYSGKGYASRRYTQGFYSSGR